MKYPSGRVEVITGTPEELVKFFAARDVQDIGSQLAVMPIQMQPGPVTSDPDIANPWNYPPEVLRETQEAVEAIESTGPLCTLCNKEVDKVGPWAVVDTGGAAHVVCALKDGPVKRESVFGPDVLKPRDTRFARVNVDIPDEDVPF